MKSRSVLLAFTLFFSVFFFGFAQGEANIWYFGDKAGIRFNNNGTVTPLDNGELFTFEGCATISDGTGNLLFYTDGSTVWDRTHEVMQNGSGLFGDTSSSQSAIIVPRPGSTTQYYIFTVDAQVTQDEPILGFNYSIVDITLNGGLGAVTSKNINLLNDSSEKLSAVVKNCFDGTIWVITQAGADGRSEVFNHFFCFEISAAGINTTPVVSAFPGLNILDPRGYLKLSPDGTKLVSANARDGLFLFDFDTDTGIVSNPQPIEINTNSPFPYGVEFSPNNRFLYIHSSNDDNSFNPIHESSLIQFDLDAANISASAVVLDQRGIFRGALQQGINGKIYRALSNSYTQGTPYLGVIENPSEPGLAANYIHNAVFLGNNFSMQGLPPFIQSIFDKVSIIETEDSSSILNLCEGDSYTLQAPEAPGYTYTWSKDGILLANTASSLALNNATTGMSGIYTVDIQPADPNECPFSGEALVNVFALPNPVNATLVQCDSDTQPFDGLSIFNLTESIETITQGNPGVSVQFFETLDDFINGNPIENLTNYPNNAPNQQLVINLVNDNICALTSTLTLVATPAPVTTAIVPEYIACDTNADDTEQTGLFNFDDIYASDYAATNTTFYLSLEDATIEQNPISGAGIYPDETEIFARVEDASNNCLQIQRFTLTVLPTPSISIDDAFICLNNPLVSLTAPGGFDRYEWFQSNGNTEISVSSSPQAIFTRPGEYRLQVSYIENTSIGQVECSNSATFSLIPSNIATFSPDPQVVDISANNSITVFVEGEGNYEYALNISGPYQDSPTFENVPPGVLTVYIRDKNGCGIVNRQVSVVGYPKFFTPNNDGANDFWQIQGVNSLFQPESLIFIFDRYGKLLKQLPVGSTGWDGTYNGRPLPSSDYWFRVYLEDGREFKGHFSLKR